MKPIRSNVRSVWGVCLSSKVLNMGAHCKTGEVTQPNVDAPHFAMRGAFGCHPFFEFIPAPVSQLLSTAKCSIWLYFLGTVTLGMSSLSTKTLNLCYITHCLFSENWCSLVTCMLLRVWPWWARVQNEISQGQLRMIHLMLSFSNILWPFHNTYVVPLLLLFLISPETFCTFHEPIAQC